MVQFIGLGMERTPRTANTQTRLLMHMEILEALGDGVGDYIRQCMGLKAGERCYMFEVGDFFAELAGVGQRYMTAEGIALRDGRLDLYYHFNPVMTKALQELDRNS